MRRLAFLLPWLALALAHEATSFGTAGGSADTRRLLVFTLLFLVGFLAAGYWGYRRAKKSGGKEILWAVFPVAVTGVVALMAGMAVFNFSLPQKPALTLEVEAQRYWWRIRYPGGLETASEAWVPVGVPVEMRATAKDVFHTLSIPGLNVKIDAIPGQTTRTTFTAKRVGLYAGGEAEYVGPSWDKARFRLLALQPEVYEELMAAINAYTPPRPPPVFLARCASCHTISGTAAKGKVGPDLTLFGLRTALGSGVWPNTPDFLRPWIQNAPGMKPGVKMPPFKDLTPEELETLVNYLEGLKPAGQDLRPWAKKGLKP